MRSDPWRPRGGEPLLVRVFLGTCTRCRGLLERFGIDVPILRELLRVSLLRLLRRDGSGLGGAFPGLMALVISFSALAFFFTGLMGGVIALVDPDPRVWLGVSQGLHMGLLILLVLGQYVQLLVDATDIEVLGARPVPDRTLFASRILLLFGMLLFFSLFTILGSLLTAPLALSWWRVLLLSPLVTILHSFLALGLVGVGISATLRLVGPKRFQRYLLWGQVLALGLLMSGGMVVQALRGLVPVDWLARHVDSFAYLPPLEAFGAWQLLSGTVTLGTVVQTLTLLVAPAAAFWVTLRLAERHFLDGIRGELTLGRADPRPWRPSRSARLLRRFLRAPQDRASAEVAASLAWREPMFVRGVVPQFVMFGAMVFGLGREAPGELAVGIASGVVLFFLMTLLAGSQPSRDHEARWVYALSPEPDPGRFLRGGIFGLLTSTLLLPTGLVCLALALWLGWRELPVVLLGLELVGVFTLLLLPRWLLGVPFTAQASAQQQMDTRNLGNVFTLMGAAFLVVGLVPLLAWSPYVLWASVLLLPLALRALWPRLLHWGLDPDARRLLGLIEPSRRRGAEPGVRPSPGP